MQAGFDAGAVTALGQADERSEETSRERSRERIGMRAPQSVRRSSTRRDTLVVTALGLGPLVALGVGAGMGRLSPNPIEDVTHVTGEWALRLLVLALAITPLRRLTGRARLAPQRRTLGLLAFAYAVLHGLTWAVLDQGLHLPSIREDLTERPFVWLGASALLAMTPLAVTSTRAWMRRLGRRWARLHRLVWVAAAAAVGHFLLLVKADEREPLIWIGIVVALAAARLWPARRATGPAAPASAG